MSLLARFIEVNQWLSKATENRLPPVFKRHIQTLYKYQVAELLNRRPGQVVLDVGGGKECPFLPYLDAPHTHLIIALDISEEELRRNPRLDHKVVADAAAHGLPFRDGSVDVVVSRSVFLALYDHCYFSTIKYLLERNGFTSMSFTLLYYQSVYFNFFYPLFILMLGYDLIASMLGIRNLASGIIVTAQRPPQET